MTIFRTPNDRPPMGVEFTVEMLERDYPLPSDMRWGIFEKEPAAAPIWMDPPYDDRSNFRINSCCWISYGNPGEARTNDDWHVYIPTLVPRMQAQSFRTWQEAMDCMMLHIHLGEGRVSRQDR